MLAVVMCVNVGMWFERFVIIVTSLSRDFLPSSWGMYTPTWVELCTLQQLWAVPDALLLFVRYLPTVAMAEVKSVMPQAHPPHEEHRPLGDYWGDAPGLHGTPPAGRCAISATARSTLPEPGIRPAGCSPAGGVRQRTRPLPRL